MHYADPSPSRFPRPEIEAFAEAIFDRMNLEPGHPMDDIVTRLGGRISFVDLMSLGESSDGSIRIDDERKFEIILPLHTSRERDRFTTAHELGHLFLHYLYPRKMGRKVQRMKARRAGSGLVEWEANWFAAAFLMPSQTFVRVHDECGGNLHELCEEFGVSLAAARIRAENLIGPHVEVEA